MGVFVVSDFSHKKVKKYKSNSIGQSITRLQKINRQIFRNKEKGYKLTSPLSNKMKMVGGNIVIIPEKTILSLKSVKQITVSLSKFKDKRKWLAKTVYNLYLIVRNYFHQINRLMDASAAPAVIKKRSDFKSQLLNVEKVIKGVFEEIGIKGIDFSRRRRTLKEHESYLIDLSGVLADVLNKELGKAKDKIDLDNKLEQIETPMVNLLKKIYKNSPKKGGALVKAADKYAKSVNNLCIHFKSFSNQFSWGLGNIDHWDKISHYDAFLDYVLAKNEYHASKKKLGANQNSEYMKEISNIEKYDNAMGFCQSKVAAIYSALLNNKIITEKTREQKRLNFIQSYFNMINAYADYSKKTKEHSKEYDKYNTRLCQLYKTIAKVDNFIIKFEKSKIQNMVLGYEQTKNENNNLQIEDDYINLLKDEKLLYRVISKSNNDYKKSYNQLHRKLSQNNKSMKLLDCIEECSEIMDDYLESIILTI